MNDAGKHHVYPPQVRFEIAEVAVESANQAQIVEMRYYGGLSITEVAEVMDISEATVNREWQTARAWLFRRLRPRRIQ